MELGKNDYFSNLTCEVRTSLASILGFVETLYDSSQSTKEKFACLKKIRSIIENTTKSLEDIEQIESFNKGWFSISSTQFSLEEELFETFSVLEASANKNKIKFLYFIEGAIPSILLSDALRLRQLLVQVATLFIRNTKRGTIQIKMGIEDLNKTWLRFMIDSTSEFLKPEFLNVFSDQIADLQTARDLSLIRTLTTSLGGYVTSTQSSLSKGQALILYIDPGPITKNTHMIHSFKKGSVEDVLPVKALTIPNFSNRSFLVVEDDKDCSDLLTHFLKRTGANVSNASEGEEAYKLALDKNFDLIFLDLQLPKLSGIEVCTKLRDQSFKNPIIALTANTALNTRLKCHDAGFSLYLTKPLSMESLFDIIPKVII